jgi:hypothetical protein
MMTGALDIWYLKIEVWFFVLFAARLLAIFCRIARLLSDASKIEAVSGL